MSNNPHAPGRSKSTSFRWDEVRALCQLYDALLQGKDVKIILRAKPIGRAFAKLVRMRARLESERREEGLPE